MVSKLRVSMAKDRKKLKDPGTMEALIKGTVTGDPEPAMQSMYAKEMRKATDTIQIRYAGVIIRRTLQSVDHAGCRISGLEPYHEHFIKVPLYPKEMENLETLAQDLVRDGTHKVAQFAGGSVSSSHYFISQSPDHLQDFYLGVRRALIHPSCNAGYPWHDPSTLEEWSKDPSRKLDLAAEILTWHLAKDNQPPLSVVKNKLKPSKIPCSMSPDKDAAPDKMVVFSHLPSSFVQIRQVAVHLPTSTILSLTSSPGLKASRH